MLTIKEMEIIGEYYVSLEAWKRGAEVFRNLGSSGKG